MWGKYKEGKLSLPEKMHRGKRAHFCFERKQQLGAFMLQRIYYLSKNARFFKPLILNSGLFYGSLSLYKYSCYKMLTTE